MKYNELSKYQINRIKLAMELAHAKKEGLKSDITNSLEAEDYNRLELSSELLKETVNDIEELSTIVDDEEGKIQQDLIRKYA